MKILTNIITIVLVSTLVSCGDEGQQMPPNTVGGGGVLPPSPPVSSPASFDTLVFEDQFANGSLDRSIWNVVGPDFWVNNEQQAYIDSSDTIFFEAATGSEDDAVLVLKPEWREGYPTPTGRIVDFVSGRINSRNKLDVTYAKVSARIRMPDAQGVWPAFWLLGYGSWPNSGETDIMEYVGEKEWTSSALHGPGYSGGESIGARNNFEDGAEVSDWHIYTVERRTEDVRFFVDEEEFFRVTRAEVEERGEWRFDRAQHLILNFALGGNYPQGVNGVNSPYPGLPAATVEAIKANEISMEVDWVRLWE